MMLSSQGGGWHCPAAWSVWAVLLEDHRVAVCSGSSQGYLELAPGTFLANTTPGVIRVDLVWFLLLQVRMPAVFGLRLVKSTSEHDWIGGRLKA